MGDEKRLNTYISVFSALISVSTATGYFLDNVAPISGWDLLDLILCLFFALLLFVIVRFFLRLVIKNLSNMLPRPTFEENISYSKYGLIAFFIILICYVVVWLAYYPGLWNYDPWQVNQVINHTYDNNHPLVHTLILGACYVLGKKNGNPNIGVVIYDWIQMLIVSGVFSYICVQVLRETKRKWFYILSIIFYAVFPFNSIMAISSTKDTIFAVLVVLTLLFLYRYLKDKTNQIPVLLSVIMIFMMLFRKNALYASLLFLISALIGVLKKQLPKKIMILLPCIIGLFLVIESALNGVLEPSPVVIREATSLPSIQMGRIYYEGFADEEDTSEIGKYIKLNEAKYNPHLADSIKSHLHVYGKRDFLNMLICSAKLFIKHPIVSIESFLYLHEGAWYLGDKSHAEVYGTNPDDRMGYLQTQIVKEHKGTKYRIIPDSKLPCLERVMERLYSANEYQKNPLLTIVLSPAFYNWILVGCMFIFLYQRKFKELIVSAFLICLIITVLFCACSIVRYYYPVFVSIPLLLAWVLKAAEKHSDKKGTEINNCIQKRETLGINYNGAACRRSAQ